MPTLIPPLRPLSYKNKLTKYKLNESPQKRQKAIDEGVKLTKKVYGSARKAAIKKKARFNVLRIYRRYKNPAACRKITTDMRYMDRRYISGGKTKNIC